MPPVKTRQGRGGRKPTDGKPREDQAPGRKAAVKQTRDATSVLFGLVLMIAIIVGFAAWMGGSLSLIEKRAVAVFDGMARSVGLSVARIDVVGASPDLEQVVLDGSGIGDGFNMFRADPRAVRSRVENLPSVRRAEVHRLWPNQILILVEPAEASALWQKDGEWRVVDKEGRELAVRDLHRVEGLPKVVGEGGARAAPVLFRDLARYPDIERRVEAALRVGNRRWDLKMVNEGIVSLPEDHGAGLARLDELQARTQLLDRLVSRLDLRDPERVYVTPKVVAPGSEAEH